MSSIQNLELSLVLYLIRTLARMSKILFSKEIFYKILLLRDFKQVDGTPESGSVSVRGHKFGSWNNHLGVSGTAARRQAPTVLSTQKFKI
jgi:hypothetical protein